MNLKQFSPQRIFLVVATLAALTLATTNSRYRSSTDAAAIVLTAIASKSIRDWSASRTMASLDGDSLAPGARWNRPSKFQKRPRISVPDGGSLLIGGRVFRPKKRPHLRATAIETKPGLGNRFQIRTDEPSEVRNRVRKMAKSIHRWIGTDAESSSAAQKATSNPPFLSMCTPTIIIQEEEEELVILPTPPSH